MNRVHRLPRLLLACLGALMLALTGLAPAQTALDFPTFKGGNARQGKAGDPLGAGSGRTFERWNIGGGAASATYVIDNYPLPTGILTNGATGLWFNPDATGEAGSPFTINDPVSPGTVYRPTYLYTNATASAVGPDPTVALVPAERRYYEWRINPGNAAGTYGVYAWLPVGPTTLAGGTRIFPQRYFVYEVLVGAERQFVDVVDTYNAGSGWVRLGNGGASTSRVVPYPNDGRPLTIRLYNTVPRDADGQLLQSGTPSNWVVYADAARFEARSGSFTASPISGTFNLRAGGTRTTLVTARNNFSTVATAAGRATVIRPVVSSYSFNGVPGSGATNTILNYWNYAPNEEGGRAPAIDNTGATVQGAGFTSSTAAGVYVGTDYAEAPLVAAATGDVRYQPELADGDYTIYAYFSGDRLTSRFGRQVVYEIREGATLNTVTVDQSVGGWVRIGGVYKHLSTAPLDVRVTNQTADPLGDTGRSAYADAIRFVGTANASVTSTPLQVTARIRKTGGTVEETPVVIIADERGVLHCVDAEGNGDGTTRTYWTYPSTPEIGNTSWVDPNVTEGIDGTVVAGNPAASIVTAIMPSGFNLSSALVQRIAGEDYLFIGASNGRVYCIAMAGRGDYAQGGTASPLPGSTRRVWTYPSDPFDSPASGVRRSNLGAFYGSLVFGTTTGGPTIYAPTTQGRVFALNAVGNANRTTDVRWRYPAVNATPLGPIVSTPALEFGNLYFGTMGTDTIPSRFLALNAETGALNWQWAAIGGTAFTGFRASPTTVTAAQLAEPNNTVFAVEDSGRLFSFRADNGAVNFTAVENERPISRASLGFTYLTVPARNLAGVELNVPVVTVPTQDGRLAAYFAQTSRLNFFGGKRAYQRNFGTEINTPAFSNLWMYVTDDRGRVTALADPSTAGSDINSADEISDEVIVEDDARGDIFRKAKLKFINRNGFRLLQDVGGSRPSYSQIVTGTTYDLGRNPAAFEWGETIYMLIYDLPYADRDPNGNPVPPPQVNLTISVDGRVLRQIPANTVQFATIGSMNPPRFNEVEPSSFNLPAPDGDRRLDGAVIAQFTLQNGGQTSLPPGPASVSFTIASGALTSGGSINEIALGSTATASFFVANPLGVRVGAGVNRQIGVTNVASDPQNRVNGSPDVSTTGANREDRLGSTFGTLGHGTSSSVQIDVFDRSLMTLLRPGGIGLQNVRVEAKDLRWQGGVNAITKRLNPTLYPNFEDSPSQRPNVSLDYPDISRDSLRVTKDPNGASENPLGFNVSLFPPTGPGGAVLTEANAAQRLLRATPFQFSLDVPRFQPPNSFAAANRGLDTIPDSVGANLAQGYLGRMVVFIDSLENGTLDNLLAKETYRAFNLMTSVAPDEKISVLTPSVDLGPVAGGTGFAPLAPNNPAFNNVLTAPFNPWGGVWRDLYKPFVVRNEGNVNLLNLGLVKRENVSTGVFQPWRIFADTNDPFAFLDGSLNLWSDLDAGYAPPSPTAITGVRNAVILPKPRVEDRVGTDLSVNPVRRANQNLGTTGIDGLGRLDSLANPTTYPPGSPRVAVSVPFGFPSGRHQSSLKVVEGVRPSNGVLGNRASWTLWPEGPNTTNPQDLNLAFTVRETRITGNPSARVATVLEDRRQDASQAANQEQAFPFANMQPAGVRDPFGTLLFAWTSNRGTINPALGVPSQPQPDGWKVFFGIVRNATTFTPTQFGGTGTALLRDLGGFIRESAASNRWMVPLAPANGYPNVAPTTLFGPTVNASTVRYGSPSFPTSGFLNPYVPSNSSQRLLNGTYLALVGEAQVEGRLVSQILLGLVPQFGQGIAQIGAPVPLLADRTTRKSKPSVVVLPGSGGTVGGALVLYGGTSGNSSGLYAAPFVNGAFGSVTPLSVGNGFDSVGSPSAGARQMQGALGSLPVAEVTFEGKLRGRPSNEVFFGRLPLNDLTNLGFVYLPEITNETLQPAGTGTFRSRGVDWDRSSRVAVTLVTGATAVNLLLDGSGGERDTRTFDRSSGLITADSRLGGRVTIDPGSGTIRFSGVTPPRTSRLLLSYSPRFLRVSPDNAGPGLTEPTLIFDQRYVSSTAFWRSAPSVQPPLSQLIPNDRLLVYYNRAAAGNGRGSRPVSLSLRFGVSLPYMAYVNPDGSIPPVTVTGAVGPYQIDPVRGQIYFTAVDEGRTVNVRYSAQLGADQAPFAWDANGLVVGLQVERDAEDVPIDQPINESNFSAFIDPFTFADPNFRRPPLVWQLWTSTRAGSTDIYFQSLAPRYEPRLR